jgi:molybdopterin biosynthesis enzyme
VLNSISLAWLYGRVCAVRVSKPTHQPTGTTSAGEGYAMLSNSVSRESNPRSLKRFSMYLSGRSSYFTTPPNNRKGTSGGQQLIMVNRTVDRISLVGS